MQVDKALADQYGATIEFVSSRYKIFAYVLFEWRIWHDNNLWKCYNLNANKGRTFNDLKDAFDFAENHYKEKKDKEFFIYRCSEYLPDYMMEELKKLLK
jgi:hypothetical protein